MEDKEKEYIKLRFGLTIKKIIEEKKLLGKENPGAKLHDKHFINSYGKLSTYSGISKATLIQIIKGRKNAASTTLLAIIEALDLKLASFGKYFDAITDHELDNYKETLTVESRNKSKLKKKKKIG